MTSQAKDQNKESSLQQTKCQSSEAKVLEPKTFDPKVLDPCYNLLPDPKLQTSLESLFYFLDLSFGNSYIQQGMDKDEVIELASKVVQPETLDAVKAYCDKIKKHLDEKKELWVISDASS